MDTPTRPHPHLRENDECDKYRMFNIELDKNISQCEHDPPSGNIELYNNQIWHNIQKMPS